MKQDNKNSSLFEQQNLFLFFEAFKTILGCNLF